MRKNKVTKVVGISGLTALAIAAPIATVVSCGNSKTNASKEASKKTSVSGTGTNLKKAQKSIDNAQKALAKAKEARAKQAKENAAKAQKEDKKYIDIVKAEIKKAEEFAKKAKAEAMKNIAKQEEELAKAKTRRNEYLVKKQTAKAKEELAKMNALEIKIAEQKIIATNLSLKITKLKLDEQIHNREEFKNKTQTLDGITKHISDLEIKIQEGAKKIQDANKKLNELNAKQAELKKVNLEVNTKKTELAKLNTEVKKYAAEAIKFDIEINAKKTELNSKIAKYTNTQNSLALKTQKTQKIQDEILKIKVKIKMQKLNSNNGSQVVSAQKAQKALEAELIKQKHELTIVQTNNTNAKNDVEKVKKELDALKLKKDALVNKITSINAQINNHKTKIKDLSLKIKNITTLINKNNGSTMALKQLTAEMLKFEAELNNLKGSKTIMEEQLKALSTYNGTQVHYLKNQEAIIAKLEKEMDALKKPLSTAALTKVKDMIAKNKQILIKEEKAFKDLGIQKTKLENHIIDLKKNLLIAGSRTMINHIKDQINSAQVKVQKLFQYGLKIKFEQKQRMIEIKARTAQVVAQTQLIVDLETKIAQTTDSKTVTALKADLAKAKADSKSMLTDLEQQRQKVAWQLSRIKDSKASLTMIEKEIAKAVTKNEILVELINQVKKYEKTLASLLKEKDRLENLIAHVYGPLYPFRINKNQITMPKQQTRFVYNGHTYKTKAEAIAHLEMDKQVYIINQTDIDSIKETNFYYYKNVAYGNKAAAATAFMGDIKTNVHHYANVPAGTKVDTYAKLEKYLFKAGTAYTVNGKSFHTIDKAIDEYMGSAHIGDGTGKTYAKMLYENSSKTFGGSNAILGLNKSIIPGVGAKDGKRYGKKGDVLRHHSSGVDMDALFKMAENSPLAKITGSKAVKTKHAIHDHSNDHARYKAEMIRVLDQFHYYQHHRNNSGIVYSLYANGPVKHMRSGYSFQKNSWWLTTETQGGGTSIKYETNHTTDMGYLNELWNMVKTKEWWIRYNDTYISITFNELKDYHAYSMDFRQAFHAYTHAEEFNFDTKFEVNGKWFNTRAQAQHYADTHLINGSSPLDADFSFTHDSHGYHFNGETASTKEAALNKFIAKNPDARFSIGAWGLVNVFGWEVKSAIENYKRAARSSHEYWTIDDPKVNKINQKVTIWKGDFRKGASMTVGGMNIESGHKYFATFGGHEYRGTVSEHDGYKWVFFDRSNYDKKFKYTTWVSMKNHGFIYNWGSTNLEQSGAWRGNFTHLTEEKVSANFTIQKYSSKAEALKAIAKRTTHKNGFKRVVWRGSTTPERVGHNEQANNKHITLAIGAKYKVYLTDGTGVNTYEGVGVRDGNSVSVHFAGATGFSGGTAGIWASNWKGGTIHHKWNGDYRSVVRIEEIDERLYNVETGAVAPSGAVIGVNKADIAGTGDQSGRTYTKVTASTDASKTIATSKTILGKNFTHAELLAKWNAHHTLTANGKTIAKVDYNANKFTFTDGAAKKAVVDRTIRSKIDGTEVMFGTQTGDAKNKVAFSQAEIDKIKQELKDKNIVKTVEYGFNNMYFNNKLDALTIAENKAKAEANALYNKNSIKEVSVNMYIELSEYEKYKTLKFFGINGHGSFSKIMVSRGYQYLNTKVPTFTYEVKRQGETTWTKVKFSPTDLSNGDKVRVIKTAINGTIMAPTEFTISGLKATAPSNVRPALTLRTFDAVEIY